MSRLPAGKIYYFKHRHLFDKMDGRFDNSTFSCAICLEDPTYRRPKALSCLHTFCENCLNMCRVVKGMIKCPTCRRKTTLPPGGVKKLPENFYLGVYKEFQRKIIQFENKTIGNYLEELQIEREKYRVYDEVKKHFTDVQTKIDLKAKLKKPDIFRELHEAYVEHYVKLKFDMEKDIMYLKQKCRLSLSEIYKQAFDRFGSSSWEFLVNLDSEYQTQTEELKATFKKNVSQVKADTEKKGNMDIFFSNLFGNIETIHQNLHEEVRKRLLTYKQDCKQCDCDTLQNLENLTRKLRPGSRKPPKKVFLMSAFLAVFLFVAFLLIFVCKDEVYSDKLTICEYTMPPIRAFAHVTKAAVLTLKDKFILCANYFSHAIGTMLSALMFYALHVLYYVIFTLLIVLANILMYLNRFLPTFVLLWLIMCGMLIIMSVIISKLIQTPKIRHVTQKVRHVTKKRKMYYLQRNVQLVPPERLLPRILYNENYKDPVYRRHKSRGRGPKIYNYYGHH